MRVRHSFFAFFPLLSAFAESPAAFQENFAATAYQNARTRLMAFDPAGALLYVQALSNSPEWREYSLTLSALAHFDLGNRQQAFQLIDELEVSSRDLNLKDLVSAIRQSTATVNDTRLLDQLYKGSYGGTFKPLVRPPQTLNERRGMVALAVMSRANDRACFFGTLTNLAFEYAPNVPIVRYEYAQVLFDRKRYQEAYESSKPLFGKYTGVTGVQVDGRIAHYRRCAKRNP